MDKQYSHYFKSVKGLEYIDVYKVLLLFDVRDPCIQHAVKKLLCAGSRGGKSREKDIQEAIVSLNRALEMMAEPLDPREQCKVCDGDHGRLEPCNGVKTALIT